MLKTIAEKEGQAALLEKLPEGSSRALAQKDFPLWLEMMRALSYHAQQEVDFDMIAKVYLHGSFPKSIDGEPLSIGTRWSLALATAQNLRYFRLSPSQRNIRRVFTRTVARLKQGLHDPFLTKEIDQVILITNQGVTVRSRWVKAIQSFGIPADRIQSFVGTAKSEQIDSQIISQALEAMRRSKGKTVILLDGHGGPRSFSFKGSAQEPSHQERILAHQVAEALSARLALTQTRLGEVFIFLDSCYNFPFIRNFGGDLAQSIRLQNRFRRERKERLLPEGLPYFYATANVDQLSHADFLAALKRRYEKAQLPWPPREVTIKDLFFVQEDELFFKSQAPGIFLPLSRREFSLFEGSSAGLEGVRPPIAHRASRIVDTRPATSDTLLLPTAGLPAARLPDGQGQAGLEELPKLSRVMKIDTSSYHRIRELLLGFLSGRLDISVLGFDPRNQALLIGQTDRDFRLVRAWGFDILKSEKLGIPPELERILTDSDWALGKLNFTPDGRWILIHQIRPLSWADPHRTRLIVFDRIQDRPVGSPILLGEDSFLLDADVSPNGETLHALIRGLDLYPHSYVIRSFDLKTGEPPGLDKEIFLSDDAPFPSAAFDGFRQLLVDPIGDRLYVHIQQEAGKKSRVTPYDLATHRETGPVLHFEGPTHSFRSLKMMALSQSGKTLYVGKREGEIIAIDVTSGEQRQVDQVEAYLVHLAVDDKGVLTAVSTNQPDERYVPLEEINVYRSVSSGVGLSPAPSTASGALPSPSAVLEEGKRLIANRTSEVNDQQLALSDKLSPAAEPATGASTGRLEERDRAVARELAVVELGRVFPPWPASVGSPVLIFSDPKTFDVVPLAVRWGRAVAVDDDGPEAAGLEELLSQMKLTQSLGPHAIGKAATRRFLREYEQPIWIAGREDALQRLGMNPSDLPSGLEEALKITRDYLGLFV